MTELCKMMLERGYSVHLHKEHFGEEMTHVEYLHKKIGGKYIYVSLVNYFGEFCEAVVECYAAPKNTRIKGKNNKPKDGELSEFHKKGFLPLETRIIRQTDPLLYP